MTCPEDVPAQLVKHAVSGLFLVATALGSSCAQAAAMLTEAFSGPLMRQWRQAAGELRPLIGRQGSCQSLQGSLQWKQMCQSMLLLLAVSAVDLQGFNCASGRLTPCSHLTTCTPYLCRRVHYCFSLKARSWLADLLTLVPASLLLAPGRLLVLQAPC